jgi:hypothetical protein
MRTAKQKLQHFGPDHVGDHTVQISLTLYPIHLAMLNKRCNLLKISRSSAIQTLVEVDDGEGILPRELRARWKQSIQRTPKTPEAADELIP